MAIYRMFDLDDEFTRVPNSWIRNPQLRPIEMWILAHILSHAAGYPLTITQMINDCADGKDAVRAAIDGLVTKGYLLLLDRERNPDGTLGSYDYELIDPRIGKPAKPVQETAGHRPSPVRKIRKGTSKPVRASRSGPDQAKRPVSTGGDQCGSAAAAEPHTEKTTTKRPSEDHVAPAPAEPNAGSIVADWIDYCASKDVRLTKQAIGRYARKIKDLLAEGFSEKLIKNALAEMLSRGQESRPGLLDNLVIEVQRSRQQPTAYRSAAERAADRQSEEVAIARIADRLIENGECPQAGEALARARMIFAKEVGAHSNVSGYSEGVRREIGHSGR